MSAVARITVDALDAHLSAVLAENVDVRSLLSSAADSAADFATFADRAVAAKIESAVFYVMSGPTVFAMTRKGHSLSELGTTYGVSKATADRVAKVGRVLGTVDVAAGIDGADALRIWETINNPNRCPKVGALDEIASRADLTAREVADALDTLAAAKVAEAEKAKKAKEKAERAAKGGDKAPKAKSVTALLSAIDGPLASLEAVSADPSQWSAETLATVTAMAERAQAIANTVAEVLADAETGEESEGMTVLDAANL